MRQILLLIVFIIFFSISSFSKPTDMIFIEDIYSLYESNLHQSQNDHKRNIYWLENSLKLPNKSPLEAIVITNTWEEYIKYKLLLRFNIHFLLTKEYMSWGWQFDKKDVVFYNIEWAEDIKKSLEIAKNRYEVARHYWDQTKKWSQLAYSKNIYIGWEYAENLNYEIETDQFEYDYDDIIDIRIQSVEEKLKKIDFFLNQSKN